MRDRHGALQPLQMRHAVHAARPPWDCRWAESVRLCRRGFGQLLMPPKTVSAKRRSRTSHCSVPTWPSRHVAVRDDPTGIPRRGLRQRRLKACRIRAVRHPSATQRSEHCRLDSSPTCSMPARRADPCPPRGCRRPVGLLRTECEGASARWAWRNANPHRNRPRGITRYGRRISIKNGPTPWWLPKPSTAVLLSLALVSVSASGVHGLSESPRTQIEFVDECFSVRWSR